MGFYTLQGVRVLELNENMKSRHDAETELFRKMGEAERAHD